jgi:uncharacterized protein YjbI with pentapeptide repeats
MFSPKIEGGPPLLGRGVPLRARVSGCCNGGMGRVELKRYALMTAAIAGALALFVVLYIWWPWLIDGARLRRPGLSTQDQSGILANDRGDVLKIVAGAGAVVALLYTARKHSLDRSGQVTDRFSKAIAQLASERQSERIGALYALERIMRDSAPDHSTVVETLAAFVRERARRAARTQQSNEAEFGEGINHWLILFPKPDADVQAAMIVLARRPKRDEHFAIDLRRTALVGLELPARARFDRADFTDADLTHARFADAMLFRANFCRASLTGANLVGANLAKANLHATDLTGADLTRANLTLAAFMGTHLTRAKLGWATLTEALSLIPDRLADAGVNASTKFDADLAQDEWVLARIEACKDWPGFGPVPETTPNPSDRPSSSAASGLDPAEGLAVE